MASVIEDLVKTLKERRDMLKEQVDEPNRELAEIEQALGNLEREEATGEGFDPGKLFQGPTAPPAAKPAKDGEITDKDILDALGDAEDWLRPGAIKTAAGFPDEKNNRMSARLKALLESKQVVKIGEGAGNKYALPGRFAS